MATAAVAALLRWLEGGGSRWVWWFCLAAIATLLLQLFAVLAPLSALVAAIVLRPELLRDRRRALIVPVGLVLAAALSLAVLGAGQLHQLAWIPSPFEGAQLTRAIAGPASGGHATYALFVLAVAVAASALCAWAGRRPGHDGSRPGGLDLRLLAILLAWAALPTVALVAASLARPVFVDRYVTASAPGLALALALLAASALDEIGARFTHRSRAVVAGGVAAAAAVVLFLAFSVPAARLTYREAIAQGPPAHRLALSIGVRRGASPETPRGSPALPRREPAGGRLPLPGGQQPLR